MLLPQPANHASFIEYLRWMRVKSHDGTIDGGTIIQLLQNFEDNDFSINLKRLTERTQKLAHEWFEATCPWRIRVGGARGPESILLPAFDALGMPYIPSSTLKGVARAIALKENSAAEVKRIFGDLDPHSSMGQVIFLDAYPLPGEDLQGGLMPDMTNAIWKWSGTTPPKYDTNPNVFLSLKESTFVIGLRRGTGCEEITFNQVKQWLIKGLTQGIGSRVNTGYGALDVKDEKLIKKKIILLVSFKLTGQLIHGQQAFTQWELKKGKWKFPGIAEAEVRPTVFRSMLRYWFRALALGVLSNREVRDLEMQIFGGIDADLPQTGLFRLEVQGQVERDNARLTHKGKEEDYGLITGNLIIRYSSQTASLSQGKKQSLEEMIKNLTWLMFHLGGVGQGARRPCYSRQNRASAPWWRGATLTARSKDEFWHVPGNVTKLTQKFQQRLKDFYKALEQFRSEGTIDYLHPRAVTIPTTNSWSEAIDSHCQIVCVAGDAKNNKPFALAVLHQLGRSDNGYNPDLCGATQIPSPVWIAKVGGLQVVTVFGSTEKPRRDYVAALQAKNGGCQGFATILPLT